MNFESSESTAKLDEALAQAQGEFEIASKDKNNDHFRSKYADITSYWGASRAALSKYKISVTQWPIHSDDGRVYILTRIAHAGEWMRATFSIPVVKQDPHGYGSAVTYNKKFTFAAAIGIVAGEEDDDGNAASNKEGVFHPPSTPSKKPAVSSKKSPVAPKPSVSALVLPKLPEGLTREEILERLKTAYTQYQGLHPQFDAGTIVMQRYAKKSSKDLTEVELYDLLLMLETELRSGVAS